MKKKSFKARYAVIAMLISCMAAFAGCGKIAEVLEKEGKEYTIQYTDDSGTHQIMVKKGMLYAMEAVPERDGYIFMGLYDAEVGGTQYISATGASLSPFTDKKDIVLFPQFQAKEYTVVLDYQGSAVTGERQFTVTYGSSLPELPKNLAGEHKDFTGWYTGADCEGTQIADQYGLLPVVSILNDANFDLSGEFVYLYAGFEPEKHTVTFCFKSGMDTEEMQVPYNTPVSKLVTDTRVDGNAVLTWSKTQDGEVFNGKITDDMVLYAVEYAPVLEFDSDGGSPVSLLVARAGSTISLPVPEKELASFSHWEDMQGNKYTAATMPGKSTSLKAVWQAKLVFDENGGSDVDDISAVAGDKITLPTPAREGFLFAGWYTAERAQYTSTTMPAEGLALKAGWYKEKSETVVVINSQKYDTTYSGDVPQTKDLCYTFDYKKYFSDNEAHVVRIDWHVKLKRNEYDSKSGPAYVDFYSQKQVSSTYLMETRTFENVTNEYREFNFTTTFVINDNFYSCWYCPSSYVNTPCLSDFYYTVHYPDTSNLYL